MLWYNTEAYPALDLTWIEPESESQNGRQWRAGGRTALELTARNSDGLRRETVRTVPAGQPVTAGATIEGADAQFWIRSGDREEPIGGALDFSDLSDDVGGKLRFTGALAGIRAHDLVDGAFSADFHGFRLATAPLQSEGSMSYLDGRA